MRNNNNHQTLVEELVKQRPVLTEEEMKEFCETAVLADGVNADLPRVCASTFEKEDEEQIALRVEVKDTGIGIKEEDKKRLFQAFNRVDLEKNHNIEGTGLGLSITKEIIHSHGEHINVISTEGVGTEFIFSLPRVDE